MVLENIIILIVSLFFIVKGAESFVKNGTRLAKQFGVSDFVIGLTLIALGTSLPELISSIIASLKNESGLIIGTITGANIANIGLIIGMTAIISKKLQTNKEMLKRDIYMLLFVAIIFFLTILNGNINIIEGILLLALFVAYTSFLLEIKKTKEKERYFSGFVDYFTKLRFLSTLQHRLIANTNNKERVNKILLIKNLVLLFLSGFIVILAANYLVKEAIFFAELLMIPPTIIGIFMAIGTTMPEMSVSIIAARKKLGGIAIGNAIGSCITNTLLVIGISALINPLSIQPIAIYFTAPFFFIISLVLFIFVKSKWEITRPEGCILAALYLIFLILAIIFGI